MDIISCRMVSTPATQRILATENHAQLIVQYLGTKSDESLRTVLIGTKSTRKEGARGGNIFTNWSR